VSVKHWKLPGHPAQIVVTIGTVTHVLSRDDAMVLWRSIATACDDAWLADVREDIDEPPAPAPEDK
jgi:hypothetical protein